MLGAIEQHRHAEHLRVPHPRARGALAIPRDRAASKSGSWLAAAGRCGPRRLAAGSRHVRSSGGTGATALIANRVPRHDEDEGSRSSDTRKFYKRGASDLCTMFIERAASLAQRRGAIGMIAMHGCSCPLTATFGRGCFSPRSDQWRTWARAHSTQSTPGRLSEAHRFATTRHITPRHRLASGWPAYGGPGATRQREPPVAPREALRTTLTLALQETLRCDLAIKPGATIAYWKGRQMLKAFSVGTPLGRPR